MAGCKKLELLFYCQEPDIQNCPLILARISRETGAWRLEICQKHLHSQGQVSVQLGDGDVSVQLGDGDDCARDLAPGHAVVVRPGMPRNPGIQKHGKLVTPFFAKQIQLLDGGITAFFVAISQATPPPKTGRKREQRTTQNKECDDIKLAARARI